MKKILKVGSEKIKVETKKDVVVITKLSPQKDCNSVIAVIKGNKFLLTADGKNRFKAKKKK